MSFWSVAQTESRREHVAAKFLEHDAFETYCPKIANGGDHVAPLFPGYLFVEIIDQWWSVRWTVGVVRLLMVNDKPAKLPAGMVESIRAREVNGLVRLPESHTRTRVWVRGDAVRVTAGLFKGRIGIYQGQSGAQRSRILLTWLGREVRAVVPVADVARLE